MGNFVRAARELPRLRQKLGEVTAQRIEAEKQLKLLKDDLDRKAVALEKHRENAILSSRNAMQSAEEQMERELQQVREESRKLNEMTIDTILARREQKVGGRTRGKPRKSDEE